MKFNRIFVSFSVEWKGDWCLSLFLRFIVLFFTVYAPHVMLQRKVILSNVKKTVNISTNEMKLSSAREAESRDIRLVKLRKNEVIFEGRLTRRRKISEANSVNPWRKCLFHLLCFTPYQNEGKGKGTKWTKKKTLVFSFYISICGKV